MALDPQFGALATRFLAAAWALLVFAVSWLAIYALARVVVVPAVRRLLDRAGVPGSVEFPVLKLLDAAFLVGGFLVGAAASGLTNYLAATAAVTAAATVALGFASRDVLSNVVSGVFIVVDPKFNVGDWIRWGDREGVVEDVSFRVTRVHTFDNELISVPNSELATTAVTNPAAKDRLRITLDFDVGYDEDLDRARAILREVAFDHPEIIDRPRATVYVEDLAADAVRLRTRFWIARPSRSDYVRIRSKFAEAAIERLDAAGFDAPHPTRELTGSIETRTPAARPDGEELSRRE